jgi:O-antigen/teichoic acid export membrane protein
MNPGDPLNTPEIPVTATVGGYGSEDRARSRRGMILTILGGLVMAGVKALGFFLRSIFGGEMWGLYAIAWALIELCAFVLIGGFGEGIVIFGSRIQHEENEQRLDKHYQALATLIRTPLLAAIFVAIALHFGAEVLHERLWSNHDPILVSLVQVLGWGLPLLVLVQVPVEATRASLRFGYSVGIVQIALPVLSLLATLSIYYVWQSSILAVAQGMFVALAICVPAAIFAFSRQYDLRRTIRLMCTNHWEREALSFAIPQSFQMMLSQGLVRIDGLMLSFFGISANAIGIYSLVGELTQLIRLAKMAFSSIYSALVAKYRAQENRLGVAEALESFASKTSALSFVPLLAVTILWPVLVLQAGEQWPGSREIPWLLCAGPMMSCFFGLCNNTLLMYGHSRVLLVNAIIVGISNVVLNALFIPIWGLEGAAWATAISNVSISFVQILELKHKEKLSPHLRFYQRTLIAAALPVAFAFYFTVYSPGIPWDLPDWIYRGALVAIALSVYAALQTLLPGEPAFKIRSPRPR